MDCQSLDTIGILEGTDKSSLMHDYLRHYERIFSRIRDEPIQLLEIGVAGGASLRVWAKFFTRATIIGVDINKDCEKFAADRIKIEIGSQDDPQFLAAFSHKYRPDIIIDDGSHQAPHIFITFQGLFPSLSPGGYYIVEDLFVHYAPVPDPQHRMTPAEWFAALARRISSGYVEPECDQFTRHLCNNIERIEFIPRAVIMRKRAAADSAQHMAYLWDTTERSGRAVTWYWLALQLLRGNDPERAELAAQRAVAMGPRNAHYFVRLA